MEPSKTREHDEDFSRAVANLTHELKTPLHSILAVAGVLQSEVDGPLNEEQRRQVDMIVRNGEQLLGLIIELLQFSSTSTAGRRLNFRRIDINSFFNDLIQGLRAVGARSNVTITSDTEGLPERFVSDATLLQRIFGNLLSNALKFSPEGGEISFFAEVTKDGTLHAQVADSGIGMEPETLRNIFGQFYQAESGDTRRFGGVGLGLALVKQSLDLLGGSIEVQSEPDRGSLFILRIPSAEAAVEKYRILILDKDETVRLSLEACLASEGHEPCFIGGEREVIVEIAGLQPDLVMLDVGAELEGFKLLKQIRDTSWGKTLPVILMSALDGPQERSKGFSYGASDFLVKPFDLTELLARVRAQLERPW